MINYNYDVMVVYDGDPSFRSLAFLYDTEVFQCILNWLYTYVTNLKVSETLHSLPL